MYKNITTTYEENLYIIVPASILLTVNEELAIWPNFIMKFKLMMSKILGWTPWPWEETLETA